MQAEKNLWRSKNKKRVEERESEKEESLKRYKAASKHAAVSWQHFVLSEAEWAMMIAINQRAYLCTWGLDARSHVTERKRERGGEREMKKGEFSTFITVIRAGHMLSLHSANEAWIFMTAKAGLGILWRLHECVCVSVCVCVSGHPQLAILLRHCKAGAQYEIGEERDWTRGERGRGERQ